MTDARTQSNPNIYAFIETQSAIRVWVCLLPVNLDLSSLTVHHYHDYLDLLQPFATVVTAAAAGDDSAVVTLVARQNRPSLTVTANTSCDGWSILLVGR